MKGVTETKVGLEGVKFNAPIGFLKEERILRNDFIVDVYVCFYASDTIDDELNKTVDYAILYQICETHFNQESKLIETVAQKIIDQIRNQYKDLEQIHIKIRKLNPPIKGLVQNSFVELNYNR